MPLKMFERHFITLPWTWLIMFTWCPYFLILKLICKKLFIYFRERGRGRERERHQFVVSLFMHSLVDSCMCPDQVLKLQLWCIGTMLLPTELTGQVAEFVLWEGNDWKRKHGLRCCASQILGSQSQGVPVPPEWGLKTRCDASERQSFIPVKVR